MKYLLIFTLGEVVLILACGQIFHFYRAIASRPDHIEFHLDICCRYRGPYCTANPITDVRQSTYASDRRTRGFVSWTVFHVFSASGIPFCTLGLLWNVYTARNGLGSQGTCHYLFRYPISNHRLCDILIAGVIIYLASHFFEKGRL